MKNLTLALTLMATIAATWAGAATIFVNEGFESATFPPAGWTILTQNSANWVRSANGPWGYFAAGTINATPSTSQVEIWTPAFAVAEGQTLYCHFDFNFHLLGDMPSGGAYYHMRYADGGGETLRYGQLLTGSSWRATDYSAVASRAGVARLQIVAYVGTAPNHSGYGGIYVDRVLIADYPASISIAPASLGRVKAVLR